MQTLTLGPVNDRSLAVIGRRPLQVGYLARTTSSAQDWSGDLVDFMPPPGAPDHGASAELTSRECTILQLLSHGLSNKEAAKKLSISPETVKSHVKNIFLKLNVERRAQAVSRGLGLGVITPV